MTQAPQDEVVARIRSGVRANLVYQPALAVLQIAGTLVVARHLGPSLLAVVATVSALSTTVTVFGDLGVTRSLPKVLPEVGVRHGPEAVGRVRRKITNIKLGLICVILGVLAAATLATGWEPSGQDGAAALLLCVAANAVSGTLLVSRQMEAAASFKNREINRFGLLYSVLVPALTVFAVLLTDSPYAVFVVSTVANMASLVLYKRYASYDLRAEPGEDGGEIPTVLGLWREYRGFSSVSYFVFLFNRFVFGLPLIVWVLNANGASARSIGNAYVAVQIVDRAWEIANVPLANLRASLLARYHALADERRLVRGNDALSAVTVLSSLGLAGAILGVGPAVLPTLYGSGYDDGITWGIYASALGLAVNCFSLGNVALQQIGRYWMVIRSLLMAGGALLIGFLIVHSLEGATQVGLLIGCYVAARGVYWLLTDLAAGRYGLGGSPGMNLRAVVAIGIGAAAHVLGRRVGHLPAWSLTPLPLMLSYAMFRISGGAGAAGRREFNLAVGTRFPILRRLV